jgi:hypothetical protein
MSMMSLSPNPSLPETALSPDLIHKLGFCPKPYTNRGRRENIKTNMLELKNWLDYAAEDSSGDIGTAKVDSDTRPRVGSLMVGRSAVLVVSSGSIRKKKKEMGMAKQSSSEAIGVGKVGEEYVSFPRLEETMEYDVQEVKQQIDKVVAAKKQKQGGLMGMFRMMFGAGC